MKVKISVGGDETVAPSVALELHPEISRIQTPAGQQVVHSRYVVGCDGARSPVRVAAQIALDDLQFEEQWLVIDALVRDAARLPQVNLQICNPQQPTTCVLMGSGRHRWEFMLKPGETPERFLDDNFIADLLKPWNVDGAVTLERKAVYRFNAKVAKAWRKGSVMLAGDAAHLMPPFAGQGMCSGLRDAANLAWKLVAVERGAAETLLDTYQIEREPHVRAIIVMSITMGRMVCTTDPQAARARDEQMLAARASGAPQGALLDTPPFAEGCIVAGTMGAGEYFPQAVATGDSQRRFDDTVGDDAWLITSSTAIANPSMHQVRVIGLDDAKIRPFREQLASWLKKHDAESVLVRPDRYVFGTGSAEALLHAWTQRASCICGDRTSP